LKKYITIIKLCQIKYPIDSLHIDWLNKSIRGI
jgi:hypothetical protein